VPFQNPLDGLDDADVYHHEIGFALQAEMWGFDSIWVDEHHFSGHSLCPDPLQLLTYFAGQTRQIRLAVAGLSLPRPDPVRLVEQIVLLDNLSAGRLLLGVDLAPSAVEAALALLDALESGEVDVDGPSGLPRRHELRPRLERSLRGRIHAAPGSSTMAVLAALRAAPVITVGGNGSALADDLAAYREAWEEVTDGDAPGPICRASVLVDDDAERLEETTLSHLAGPISSLHGTEDGHDLASGGVSGTPEQVLARLGELREQTGMTTFTAALCFGGLPYDEAERNIACFVDQVLPTLQAWETEPCPPATPVA
jgi:alkanesulfonate monooxygenase SsuD/methylene tetrahydromethanopterin reductase-like flavin-dependent oxidoreductase (luciferase family)